MAFQTLPQGDQKGDRPWWLVAFVVMALALGIVIFVSDLYTQVFSTVVKGLGVTVFVTLIGFLLATTLGLLIALLGMSDHMVLRQVARFYVEVVRGIPILVQLFYIYFVLPEFGIALSALQAAIIGLGIAYSAYQSENFRAGIEAIPKGQFEAANAIGLSFFDTMRDVVLPQALRVIIPPLTSQYLNLTKNSSLGVAVGFPELVSTGGTTLNQTGQAIEIVSIWLVVYLSISIVTSLFMNWFNAKMALVER